MIRRTGTVKIDIDEGDQRRFYGKRITQWTFEIDGVRYNDDWYPTRWQAKEALLLVLEKLSTEPSKL